MSDENEGFPPVNLTHYPLGGSDIVLREMIGFGIGEMKILIEVGDEGPEVTASVTDGEEWELDLSIALTFIAAAALQPSQPAIADKLIDALADLNVLLPAEPDEDSDNSKEATHE